jgi:hypothetical protein
MSSVFIAKKRSAVLQKDIDAIIYFYMIVVLFKKTIPSISQFIKKNNLLITTKF